MATLPTLIVVLICVTATANADVNSCFGCSYGDNDCLDPFSRTDKLLISCQGNMSACYKIIASRPGGGTFIERGCLSAADPNAVGQCMEYKQDDYVGSMCCCGSEQCNKSPTPVLVWTSLTVTCALTAVVANVFQRRSF